MRAAVLPLSGAAMSACVLFWALSGDQTGRVPTHLACFGVAFAAYLLALGSSRDLSRRGLFLAQAYSSWRAEAVVQSSAFRLWLRDAS